MLVAFHLHRKPLSSGAKLTRGYTAAIRERAAGLYSGPLVTQPVYSRIIWFHKYRLPQGDVDNIIKKIHDALIGIVFTDDRVVTHTMAVRVDATEGVEIEPDPASPESAARLVDSINDPALRDVLYIEVGVQKDQRIYLGPIA